MSIFKPRSGGASKNLGIAIRYSRRTRVVGCISGLLILNSIMSPQQQRSQQALAYLKLIQKKYSTVYFVGLLMGIISRLAIKDYDLMHELKQRSEQTTKE